MSGSFNEGRLSFSFPAGWEICRLSSTAYYERHFQRFTGGSKEMDFLALNTAERTLWLIEVKDYSSYPRTKLIDLAEEVAIKVRDSLALLLPAIARDSADRVAGQFAERALGTTSLRVVLHCEFPANKSKLFPSTSWAANIKDKLRNAVRCVDPHPILTDRARSGGLAWSVSQAASK